MSPNDPDRVTNIRSDLNRIKALIDSCGAFDAEEECHMLRELLTSYMAMTEREYLTDEHMLLNSLCKRVLQNE